MRIHANQPNPYAQLDALYAAEKAAAKREAAKTRRKLMEFASALVGEAGVEESGVTRLEAREEPQERNKQLNARSQGGRKKQKEAAESEDASGSISEWA